METIIIRSSSTKTDAPIKARTLIRLSCRKLYEVMAESRPSSAKFSMQYSKLSRFNRLIGRPRRLSGWKHVGMYFHLIWVLTERRVLKLNFVKHLLRLRHDNIRATKFVFNCLSLKKKRPLTSFCRSRSDAMLHKSQMNGFFSNLIASIFNSLSVSSSSKPRS